jgi:hypothetical protein
LEEEMSSRKTKAIFLGKLVLAAIAIIALVAIPARELAPSMALFDLVLYLTAGASVLIGLVVLGLVFSLQFSQFILRSGGTDAQWLSLPSEPKGLVALREQEADRKRKAMRDES